MEPATFVGKMFFYFKSFRYPNNGLNFQTTRTKGKQDEMVGTDRRINRTQEKTRDDGSDS